MEKLGLNQIREKFLSFYESKEHMRLKSFPLVPKNDASLLLINAGMAPLKPYFTGKEDPPAKRVTTCQKCIRTPDIERVGKTARHGTFFEMLGNFSFGDYFKREAISWAWEFVTKELCLPLDRLWVTVYQDDDEAAEIWEKEIGIAPERIVRMGKEDNFWEIGTGPCGPCSEIYFDRGEDKSCGPDCKMGCDCDRFVEFWNLVFTQFDKDEEGNYNPLAHPNIDTGMGLERLATIMQGVDSIFEVDTIRNLMSRISEASGVKYGQGADTDVSLRVITDHVRSTAFMISDNVAPSNEGRGYVLRRLLRRAARHGKLLGIEKPFLYEVVDTLIEESKGAYPELFEKRDYIKRVIKTEEERFDETIDTGLQILNDYVEELKKAGQKMLSGENAFKLYDTYGFPIDLTTEILAEKGMEADVDGFNKEMEIQKTRARQARKEGEEAGWSEDAFSGLDKSITTEFSGYEQSSCKAKTIAIIADGKSVETVHEGEQAGVIFDKTVFYGESGGQVGDTGKVSSESFEAEVCDTKKVAGGKIVHYIKVTSGALSVGDGVNLEFDIEKRRATQRNHSVTHLIHAALRKTLGDHVEQAGSMVTPDRFRFDFSHFEALPADKIREIEKEVNSVIMTATPVIWKEMPIEEAKAMGAMALFGEKYGQTVRVVRMGEYSTELCGGCHVANTGEIGLCKILSESSVAAGVRRVEGVTGFGFMQIVDAIEETTEDVAAVLKINKNELQTKIRAFVEELHASKKALEQLKMKMAAGESENLLLGKRKVEDVDIITARVDNMSIDQLRNMGDQLKSKMETGVVVLATVNEEKLTFICMATKTAVAKGVHAGNIIREVAKVAGGGGGGKPDSAQAGGKDILKADDALAIVDDMVKSQLK